MENKQTEKWVEVFGGSPWEAEVVKGLLEANGLTPVLKDETLGSIVSPYADVNGVVRVMVSPTQYETAVQLVEQRGMEEE